ncbi:hypothetical protein KIPB_012444, partial [Kipferlia bialata]
EPSCIDLSRALLTPTTLVPILTALEDTPWLRQVNLSHNKLSGCGSVVARFLTNSLSLSLSLDTCGISDHDVITIAHTLGKNLCALESLSLDNNGLSSAVCASLGKAVTSPDSRLRVLSLNGNRLGDTGAEVLLNHVARAPTLQ